MIEFKDYPDTSTPLNAENLNYNFSHIVESGSNENGSWIKWADGTMICTKTIVFNEKDITLGAWGTLYFRDVDCGNWAQTFTALTGAFASGDSSQYLYSLFAPSTTGAMSIRIIRPDANVKSANLFVFAIGRWK